MSADYCDAPGCTERADTDVYHDGELIGRYCLDCALDRAPVIEEPLPTRMDR